jgi:hypothetical protein
MCKALGIIPGTTKKKPRNMNPSSSTKALSYDFEPEVHGDSFEIRCLKY